ncbi:glycoside hydrolase family 3 C-terminal domain-containing protein [Granulicella tundricola]|uniref:Glycoside hydrolase family 3 domain protein n=1 Tax=Granulicella tundricola (strain ATCC BAA-1859 / DSM 23138 / MP5ACTX9) TaxID=1198114 RepID=E8X6R3_GRATM|nr:glycoside hydrolase family 3 C-terminal domain-containing protein [Granulicella tundricola]ADW71213.1 glycoside hydrolase family 3 domain protein [Granulicella tundricola MP5ACTX9]
MRFISAALILLAATAASAQNGPQNSHQDAKPLPYMDPALTTQQRVDDLVSRMTLEEKVSQTINSAPAISRLNVPEYDYWSEGLHGIARSGYATMFPQAIGMAATWDAPLLQQIGDVISIEARAKFNEAIRHNIHSIYYGLTIWSPNINIFRDPRWGRGQETYGEDPFLTGRLGVAFVKGIQGPDPNYFRAIATPKHFAVHSGPESTRHSANIEPTPHDLHDTYLPAFRATITEAHADSIMCAYNAVEGSPACASKLLLQDTLRRDWGFKGFVTSDCGAIDDFYATDYPSHHTSPDKEAAAAAGIKAGTDSNCGQTYLTLGSAVKKGLVTEAEIDTALKHLFTARFQLGLFDPAAKVAFNAIPFSEVNSPAHQALALKAAEESIVLLKNDAHTLPFKPSVRTIAVIGPSAATLNNLEGNYNAIPLHPVLPLDGILTQFKSSKVLYAQGSSFADGVAIAVPRTVFHLDMTSPEQGLKAEYFATDSFDGTPVATRIDKQIDFDWNSASPIPGAPAEAFAVRWSGTIAMQAPGAYDFQLLLTHCYPCNDHERFDVYLDGKSVGDFAAANNEYRPIGKFTLNLPDTARHALRVEYRHKAHLFGAGITLAWVPKPGALLPEAVAAAKKADVVVAFLGLSPELEGEEMPIHIEGFAGGDRTDIKLPAAQQQMLEAVAATGKPLVVVLLNGSALAVNWANDHAAAILEAWYPGQAGGTAIAETLAGKNNPAGRLPVTFYSSIDQIPAFDDYSMANRTYRYSKAKPLFEFGYGLSYTTFTYSNIKLSTQTLHAGDPLTVEADVRNTGRVAGDEVAELYLTPPHTAVSPQRALSAFTRVHLAPGELRHVTFTLDPRTLSQVDEKGARAVTPGNYTLSVSGTQPTSQTPAIPFTINGIQPLPH